MSGAVAAGQQPASVSPEPSAVLMVADFNQGGWRTNLGDPFGGWDRDPEDATQFCRPRLVEEPRVGGAGYSLKLSYDVDSPNPAYNGFWMKLHDIPLQQFSVLSFVIKGDAQAGFTTRVKVELKDRQRVASYLLNDITDRWIRMRIPLAAFRNIEKLRQATEFVIVFDDQTVTEPVGAVFLDEVAFESQ